MLFEHWPIGDKIAHNAHRCDRHNVIDIDETDFAEFIDAAWLGSRTWKNA
jgi:hypothetical protein